LGTILKQSWERGVLEKLLSLEGSNLVRGKKVIVVWEQFRLLPQDVYPLIRSFLDPKAAGENGLERWTQIQKGGC
jgi:hypothetical protein